VWLIRLKSIRSIGQTEESEKFQQGHSVEGSGEIDKNGAVRTRKDARNPDAPCAGHDARSTEQSLILTSLFLEDR